MDIKGKLNKIKEKINWKIVVFIPIILWMILVFWFSGQEGQTSKVTSGDTIKQVVTTVKPNLTEAQVTKKVEELQPIGRKLAHYSLYTYGGFLIYFVIDTFKLKRLNKLAITLLIGVLYAITDEIHQIFVPERCGRVFDVMVDSAGVVTGIILANIMLFISAKIKNKIKMNKKIEN